ncbi:MAG: hypothetical protein PSX37_10595 [bacterium]|nr:hypothetical protein [bacterium]
MIAGTVVLLPTTDDRLVGIRGLLLNAPFSVFNIVATYGPEATDAARICAAITAAAPNPPLTIVALGSSATLVPAVALAQRSAHRRVREYVLVEPDLPAVSDGWPDAHVTVFSDAEQNQARLRGWTIRPLDSLVEWAPTEY